MYSALAVTVFFACQALSQPFMWVALNSLNYDLIDNGKREAHYAYVCDKELYLNAGRILAILVFIGIVYSYSAEVALRFSPLIVAVSQVGLILLARSTEKHHSTTDSVSQNTPTVSTTSFN